MFRLFDDVLLLGQGGRTVYFGKNSNALQYFERNGFECPQHENAADFLLDVISGSVPQRDNPQFLPEDLINLWANSSPSTTTIHIYEEGGVDRIWTRPLEYIQDCFKSYNLMYHKHPLQTNRPSHSYPLANDFLESELKQVRSSRETGEIRKKSEERITLADSDDPKDDPRERFSTTTVRQMIAQRDRDMRYSAELDNHLLGMLPGHFEVMKKAFENLKIDQRGYINTKHLKIMLSSFGQEISDRELQLLLEALEIQEGSYLSFLDLE